MGKIRIYDLASRYGKSSAEIKELLNKGGMSVGSASASVDEASSTLALAEPTDMPPLFRSSLISAEDLP